MIVRYSEWLYQNRADLLERIGNWTIKTFKEDPSYHDMLLDHEGKLLGFWAQYAEKEFASPREAMLDFERVTGCDVISARDHDGAYIHCFHWGFETGSIQYASGWDCVEHIYGIKGTPREVAAQLAEILKGTRK